MIKMLRAALALLLAVSLVAPAPAQVVLSGGPASAPAYSGNLATRIYGGRMETVTTIASSTTFESVVAIAGEADAVQIVFAAGYDATATTASGILVAAAAVPALDQTSVNGATWVTGLTSVTLAPAPAVDRRNIVLSPWLRVSSVARTDGGSLSLIAMRAYLPASTVVTLGAAGGTDSFTNWATHPSGRIFRLRQQTNNSVTTPANFTTVTDRSTSPIVGIRYIARGKVYSTVGFGDSITDARGTYIGEGWGQPAAIQMQGALGIPVEYSNLAWAGKQYTRIADEVTDAIAAGLTFDLAYLPSATPNSLGLAGGVITPAEITLNRTYRATAMTALASAKIPVVTWTVLPTDPSIKDYNASDMLRVADNAVRVAGSTKGEIVANFALKLSGPIDSDGQVGLLAVATNDKIHPNDLGNAMLGDLAARAGLQILKPPAGALIN